MTCNKTCYTNCPPPLAKSGEPFSVTFNKTVVYLYNLCRKNLQESEAQDQGSNRTNKKENNNIKKNQHASNREQSHDKDKNGRREGTSGDGQEEYPPAKVMKADYFGEIKEKKMTVFFHAVLAPHFKFEGNQGDKIFMRFGGVPLGSFEKNIVEVFPER